MGGVNRPERGAMGCCTYLLNFGLQLESAILALVPITFQVLNLLLQGVPALLRFRILLGHRLCIPPLGFLLGLEICVPSSHLLTLEEFTGKDRILPLEFFNPTDQFLSLLIPKERHCPLPLPLFFLLSAAYDLDLLLRFVNPPRRPPFSSESFTISLLALETCDYSVKFTGVLHRWHDL